SPAARAVSPGLRKAPVRGRGVCRDVNQAVSRVGVGRTHPPPTGASSVGLSRPPRPPCRAALSTATRFSSFLGGIHFMRKLLAAWAALLCPFFLPPPVVAADFKTATPAVVVRVHSLGGLLGDLKHLADLSGQGELLKPLEDLLEVR